MEIDITKIEFRKRSQNNNYGIYYNDVKIGEFELFIDNKKYWLSGIGIDNKKMGYGTEVIKKIKKEYQPFRISLSSKNVHQSHSEYDTRYLTAEGFEFVKRCFEKNILERINFEFPFSEKSDLYVADSFLENHLSIFSNLAYNVSKMLSGDFRNTKMFQPPNKK